MSAESAHFPTFGAETETEIRSTSEGRKKGMAGAGQKGVGGARPPATISQMTEPAYRTG